MKRLLVLVLLVPILALTMISCDADMRSSLAGFMGGFNNNVYADAGFIVANTAQAEAVAELMVGIGNDASAPTAASFGVNITVPATATLMLSPQEPKIQEELKKNLGVSLGSPDQKKLFLEKAAIQVTNPDQMKAAQGTVLVLNETLDELERQLSKNSGLGETLKKLKIPEIADTDNLSQGDLLALQLMTDLIDNTVRALKGISVGDDLNTLTPAMLEDNKTKLISIVDDALFAANIAVQISGSGAIDFTKMIETDGLFGSKGVRSRGESVILNDIDDIENYLGTINKLGQSIIYDFMGVKEDSGFSYTAEQYNSFLLNQKIFRSAMEEALELMEMAGLKKKDVKKLQFDVSTLVRYAVSVFITEHDDYRNYYKANVNPNVPPTYEIILAYLTANKKLGGIGGELDKNDVLAAPTIDNFDYDHLPDYYKNGRTVRYYEKILTNIIVINENSSAKIPEMNDELEKLNLTEWFDEL